MTKISTKYFGEIDVDNLEEYYATEIELNTKPVEFVITVDNSNTIDTKSINDIENYIDNIKKNEEAIRAIIHEDFKEEGETKNYIDFLIEDQDDDDISRLTKHCNKNLEIEEQLLSVFYVLRINFYPEKEDKAFAVYDYTIDEDITNDLLVIILAKDNGVRITIES